MAQLRSRQSITIIILSLLMLFQILYLLGLQKPWKISFINGKTDKNVIFTENSSDMLNNLSEEQYPPPEGLSLLLPYLSPYGPAQRIGLLNLNDSDILAWNASLPKYVIQNLSFTPIPSHLTWRDFNPNSREVKGCPDIVHPLDWSEAFSGFGAVIARIPCQMSDPDWSRDMHRIYLTLLAAAAAGSDIEYSVSTYFQSKVSEIPVLIISECRPIPNLFHCSNLWHSNRTSWLYMVNKQKMRDHVAMPLGSCAHAIRYGNEGSLKPRLFKSVKKEAYVSSFLHNNYYLCGALVLAHTIRKTNSSRDMVMLIDDATSNKSKLALMAAGWKLHPVKELNPSKEAPRGYLYTKLRMWELMDYDRAIFIDSDILVLKNLDFLFDMPELSVGGDNNNRHFNTGLFVYRPSRCMIDHMQQRMNDIVSMDGTDQGFLYEFFTWWHRLPEEYNFLRHQDQFNAKDVKYRTRLFQSEPPIPFTIHYVGGKPWGCRNTTNDCETDPHFRNDPAHQRWWSTYNSLPKKLRKFC